MRPNKNKHFILAIYLFILIVLLLTFSCQNPNQILQQIEVVDGDTFKANSVTFRIIGIDTPETYSGSSKPIGEFGQDAKNYFKWFASNFNIIIEQKGQDNYGRKLVYVFGSDSQGKKYLYEASVTELGYARPLFYEDNYVKEYAEQIIKAYKKAYDEKLGIFSKLDTAPVINPEKEPWISYVGKIVYLEIFVKNIYKSGFTWYISSDSAIVKIREEEFKYLFRNFDLYSLKNKTVRFYGELWNDSGKATILLRAPYEIFVTSN